MMDLERMQALRARLATLRQNADTTHLVALVDIVTEMLEALGPSQHAQAVATMRQQQQS